MGASEASRTMLGFDETYEAIGDSWTWRQTTRDVVIVSGSGAADYLQGQCSQEVEALGEGASTWTLVLSPQGKVVVLARVTRWSSDRYILDVDPGWGAVLEERLRRFKLRVRAEIARARWICTEVRGPLSSSLVEAYDGAANDALGAAVSGAQRFGIVIPIGEQWHGVVGSDVLEPGFDPDEGLGGGAARVGSRLDLLATTPPGDPAAFELARIEAGIPAMASELDESTIPQAAGLLEWTVSFTKGCYTGQELVARLDARGGRVPSILRGVELAPGARAGRSVSPGDVLELAGRRLGTITSVSASPRTGAAVALAYVRREVVPPADLVVSPGGDDVGLALEGSAPVTPGEGSGLVARVLELPLVRRGAGT